MKTAFFEKLSHLDWQSPTHWRRLRTIDAHTGGEPLRIFLDFPELPGKSILERRRYCREHYDAIRTATMWEPRGHADMYGCILTPPATPDSDFGVIFTHNEGYSSMCGHGIIAITTVVLETGLLPMQAPITRIKIDSPAGLITAYARIENNHVSSVYFHNVPSFVVELDAVVNVPGIGQVRYDLAFGGAFYAYVQAHELGISTAKGNVIQMIDWGRKIKHAVMTSRKIEHPVDEDLSFLYGTIFIDKPEIAVVDSRNVCVFADGEVDRSPTGTGVSARAALHYKRGELGLNECMQIESILGTVFKTTPKEIVSYGPYEDAVIAEIEGCAYITGCNTLLLDPADPLGNGFIFR